MWLHDEVGHTDEATKELKKIFPELPRIFQTPKPTRLMSRILKLGCDSDSIVLDFFAGSSSTAHAVLKENADEASSIKFIMVQLPETIEDSSFTDIAAFSKERLRRAIGEVKNSHLNYQGDLGFKVFKLDSSNIRAWNPDVSDLEHTLKFHEEHLVSGRSEEDILYELLLKRGVDLTAPIERKTVAGKILYSIGYGVLFACLDESIRREDVEPLAQGVIDWHGELAPATDTHVFFRDSAFDDDIAKTNLSAILHQHGISHVRSL